MLETLLKKITLISLSPIIIVGHGVPCFVVVVVVAFFTTVSRLCLHCVKVVYEANKLF